MKNRRDPLPLKPDNARPAGGRRKRPAVRPIVSDASIAAAVLAVLFLIAVLAYRY